MVKMTIKEAADSLHSKGVISNEEYGLLKEAAISMKGVGAFAKDVMPTIAFTGMGIGALQQLFAPAINKAKAVMAYNKMTEKYPELKEKDPDKVKDYFQVIESFSPKAATNPLVAGALVNKMIEFGGVDHKLVQDIANIQSALPLTTGLQDLSAAAAKSLMSSPDGLPPTETTYRHGDMTTKFFTPASGSELPGA